MSEQSISEIYAFQLQNEEPGYYSRIPHIISYLTYDCIDPDTGEVLVKKLSPNARELYRVIKMTASDGGCCWKSRDTLAEECGMSIGAITNAKKELQQKFHQLDGNSLIKLEKKQKTTVKEGQILNKTTYDTIVIVNIWTWNNAFGAIKNKKGALSPHDGAGGALSPHDTATQEALSPHDTNNNPIINNPLYKEQQPTATADIAVSFICKNRLFPSEKQRQAYEWMVSKGCKEATAYKIAKQYSPEDIQKASEYTKERLKKGSVDSHWAYFQSTLQKRYWEQKRKAS